MHNYVIYNTRCNGACTTSIRQPPDFLPEHPKNGRPYRRNSYRRQTYEPPKRKTALETKDTADPRANRPTPTGSPDIKTDSSSSGTGTPGRARLSHVSCGQRANATRSTGPVLGGGFTALGITTAHFQKSRRHPTIVFEQKRNAILTNGRVRFLAQRARPLSNG